MGKYRGYEKYKDSGVEWLGVIPEHWRRGTLKRISERVVVGIAEAATYAYVDEGVPILRATNIRENKIIGDILKVDTEYSEGRESKLIKAGDLVTVRTGNAGVTALIPEELDQCQCFTMLITTLINQVNNHFYCYFINSQLAKSYFSLEGWGTAQINISVPILKELPILIPPPDEQEAIARFLDYKTKQIDDLIAKKEALIEKLDEKRTALISHAVTKGLDPNVPMKDSGIEWLGKIPEHWEVKRLRYIGSCQNGISKGADYFGFGYPFVNYTDVYANLELPNLVSGLANSTDTDRIIYSVKTGDVFFTRTSETIEEIGITSTCFSSIDNAIFSGFLIRFRPFNNLLFTGFSKYYFRCQLHRFFFVKEMNLVTRASLSQELLKKLPVLLPTLKEQQKIAGYLDQKNNEIEHQKTKVKKAIELLKEYRTALITNAVTGKIDVRHVPIP